MIKVFNSHNFRVCAWRKITGKWHKFGNKCIHGEFISVLLEFFANAQSMIFDLALKLFLFHMFNFVLISLVHPSRKICHLYLTYCVVVSVSGSCSTKCFWLCPLFHFPWKQLSHSKSPRVPRSHLTHQGTILAALCTFTWSFIVSSKNGRNSAKIRYCWILT